MDFAACLQAYIDELGCTAKELSAASGVSEAAISRYRASERQPDADGDQVVLLARGLAALSSGRLDEQQVSADLARSISGLSVGYAGFIDNLNALLKASGVRKSALAKALSFDTSHISRVLAGERRIANTKSFLADASCFLASALNDDSNAAVVELVGENWAAIEDEDARARAIARWLAENRLVSGVDVGGFLEKVDDFDLDDFIRAIRFDEIKLPSAAFQLPTTRTYAGLEAMKQAELDYLKATVLARSRKDVIMYSDMPMTEMADDEDFSRKWMLGMALLLKKGLRLRMIHNTARPLPEMMLGLESWIPLYMTGLVEPYYYPELHSEVFCHLLKVSGSVALSGEAIAGHVGEGRYVLTKNHDEVAYYRRRAERMLEHASPLMRILAEGDGEALDAFEDADALSQGSRRIIMATLPLATAPVGLVEQIARRNGAGEGALSRIVDYHARKSRRLETMLSHSSVTLEVPDVSSDEFARRPVTLELPAAGDIGIMPYSYEEYCQHRKALREFAAAHPALNLVVDPRSAFRNIQILIRPGKHVLVSKSRAPAIHFLIMQPALVAAFEQFEPPMVS